MNDSDRVVFSATLPLPMRQAVEALFFFNPRQSLSHDGIHETVAQAGMPAIAASDDRRPAADTIWISHLAVDPAYAYGGEHAALGIAMRLVDRVMTIARSVKGVARVQLPYRDGACMRVDRAGAAFDTTQVID